MLKRSRRKTIICGKARLLQLRHISQVCDTARSSTRCPQFCPRCLSLATAVLWRWRGNTSSFSLRPRQTTRRRSCSRLERRLAAAAAKTAALDPSCRIWRRSRTKDGQDLFQPTVSTCASGGCVGGMCAAALLVHVGDEKLGRDEWCRI